jgi:hypothetical protein
MSTQGYEDKTSGLPEQPDGAVSWTTKPPRRSPSCPVALTEVDRCSADHDPSSSSSALASLSTGVSKPSVNQL